MAVVTLTAGVARASPGAGLADPGFLAGTAAALLLPSAIGADIRANGGSQARFVLGWSYQIPISGRKIFDWPSPHRAVVGGDLLLGGGTGGSGRLGYRYSTRRLFAGAGVAANSAGPTWSPELGIRFAHLFEDEPTSLHLLVRGEIEPQLQGVRAVTILLGWNLLL